MDQEKKNNTVFEVKQAEVKLLKNVIKKNGDDMDKKKVKVKEILKLVKSREKEVHDLENKGENMMETIKSLRRLNSDLKNESKKLEKSKKQYDLKHKAFKNDHSLKKPSTSNSSTSTFDLNTLTSKTNIDGLIDSSCIKVKSREECAQCMKFSVTKVELAEHIGKVQKEIVSSSELNYKCNFCEHDFDTFPHLILHIKSSHKFNSDPTFNLDEENNEENEENTEESIEDSTEWTDVEEEPLSTVITCEQFEQVLAKFDWFFKSK